MKAAARREISSFEVLLVMNVSIKTLSIALSTATLSTLVSCQTPSTSSSSNWVVCEMPVDCVDVASAVDCVDGYCVDEVGERVEVSATGGAGSGGLASGGTSADGGSAAGGAGSGGDAMNLGGQGATGSGGATTSTCDDFAPFATCSDDDECTTGQRVTDCCGTTLVTGVAIEQEAAFYEVALECALAYPACGCPSPAHPLTDDGRWLTSGEALVACIDGQCQTAVGERPCGESTCAVGEICILATTVTGPSETREFSCIENPCEGEPLDCTCAEAVCDLGDGRSRLCTPVQEEADILCEDQAQ